MLYHRLGEFDSVATYWKSPSNPSEVLLRMKANLNVTLSPGRKTTVDIRHIPMPAHVQLIMNITAGTSITSIRFSPLYSSDIF